MAFRWTRANKLFATLIGFLALLGWWDSQQIVPFHKLNSQQAWSLYEQFTTTSFIITGLAVFGILGYVAYIYTKDRGLAAGAFAGGTLMFLSGVEDAFFFLVSNRETTACMDWFERVGHANSYVADFLGAQCVTPEIMYLTAGLGVFLGFHLFHYLRLKYQ